MRQPSTQLVRVFGARQSGRTTAALDLAYGSTLYVGRTTRAAAIALDAHCLPHRRARRTKHLEAVLTNGATVVFSGWSTAHLVGHNFDCVIVDAGENLRLDCFAAYLTCARPPRRIVVVSGDTFRDLALWGEVRRALLDAQHWVAWCRKGQAAYLARLPQRKETA